ncbi:MAG: YdeI/OmpD-associated family protein [Bacteroidota bacterium]
MKKQQTPLIIPEDFQFALNNNTKAKEYFEKLPPSHKREYLGYVNEGKKPETRARHIAKTMEALSSK